MIETNSHIFDENNELRLLLLLPTKLNLWPKGFASAACNVA